MTISARGGAPACVRVLVEKIDRDPTCILLGLTGGDGRPSNAPPVVWLRPTNLADGTRRMAKGRNRDIDDQQLARDTLWARAERGS